MALAVATAGRLRPSLCLALRLYLFHPGFHDHLFNWFVLDDLFRYGGRFAALAASTALVPVAALATTVAVMAFHRRGKRGNITIQPFDILAGQLFDCIEIFSIAACHDLEIGSTAGGVRVCQSVSILAGAVSLIKKYQSHIINK